MLKSYRNNIRRIEDEIRRADCVLIGAGAGLSAAAGLDYGDTRIFATLFPQLVKKGFRRQYELIGYNSWSEEESWAYWSTHVNYVRFTFPPSPLYQALLSVVADKDYFVITSNVDAMFYKTGFAANRIYTPQGDYARLQCVKPCTFETWPTKPVIDKILPAIDPESFAVSDSSLIPRCPRCGGRVFLNVHLDAGYNAKPYEEGMRAYRTWLSAAADKKLLLLELGVGLNSPGVIRWPFEYMTRQLPYTRLIRVNTHAPEVPPDLMDRSISMECDIRKLVCAQQVK